MIGLVGGCMCLWVGWLVNNKSAFQKDRCIAPPESLDFPFYRAD